MNADRVTLTDDERDAIVAVNHCQPDGVIMRDLVPVIEAIIANREQVLREDIAGKIQARPLAAARELGRPDGVRATLHAARIARGVTR